MVAAHGLAERTQFVCFAAMVIELIARIKIHIAESAYRMSISLVISVPIHLLHRGEQI
jgi:hypothetical protein